MQGFIMTFLLIWNVTIFGGKRDGKFQAFLLDHPPPWNSVVSKSRKFIFLVKDLLAGWDHDGLFLIVTIGDKGFQLFREDVRCGFSPVFVIAHLEYHLK